MHEIDEQITWDEFKKAITKLKSNKSLGLNIVPSNVFETIHGENFLLIFNFVKDFWDMNTYFDGCHKD